jgi:hypothetical protein
MFVSAATDTRLCPCAYLYVPPCSIGILCGGALRAVGTPGALRSRHGGGGHTLTLGLSDDAPAAAAAHAAVTLLFPDARPLRSAFAAVRAYHLPHCASLTTADVFERLHASLGPAGGVRGDAAATGIREWSVAHVGMDEVFTAVVAGAKADAQRLRRRRRAQRADA